MTALFRTEYWRGLFAPDVPLGLRIERGFAVAVGLVALIVFGAAFLIAVTVPYGGWDSLYYGTWSRLIGLHGGFHYPGVLAVDLQRPFFYVLQGEIWHVFGFHEALGRLLSLLFAVTFVVAVVRIAYVWGGLLYGAAVGAVALAITDVAVHSSDGLTDVPAAAMIALVALVLWTTRAGRRRVVLLVLTALLAVLAKPSGVVGCISLCLAEALGSREELVQRLRQGVAPIAGGVALGLAYDWTQAHHEHMSLHSFLQSGVGAGIWAQKSAAARPEALWGSMWLGRPLHLLLIFGVAYAVLRVCRVDHRLAVYIAAPVSWIWAWAGPAAAGHSFHAGLSLSGLASYAFALATPAAALAPPERVPSVLRLGRLLVWAIPAYAIWVEYAAYDTRLVSAAWPALVLLLGGAAALVLAGLQKAYPAAAVVAAAALALLALTNVVSLNGFGKTGWQQYRSQGVSGFTDHALMRNVAYGQFGDELTALRPQVGSGDRIFSEDGRLPFFYPGRVKYDNPSGCDDVTRYRAVVLLFSDESIAQGGRSVADMTQCRNPRLYLVAEVPGNYAILTVGPPRSKPSASDCGAQRLPSGIAAIFGTSDSQAGAQRIVDGAKHYGFVQVQVLQTGCNQYLAVEPGLTEQQATGTVQEAKSVDLHVVLRRVP